ncbi:hypothetical protein ABZ565_04070 [Streptomyces sp. NPDC016469]
MHGQAEAFVAYVRDTGLQVRRASIDEKTVPTAIEPLRRATST